MKGFQRLVRGVRVTLVCRRRSRIRDTHTLGRCDFSERNWTQRVGGGGEWDRGRALGVQGSLYARYQVGF